MAKSNESTKSIGERISRLRTAKNETQKEMATALFVDRVTVSQWENGERDIKTGNIVSIAAYLGVSTDYLLGVSDIKTTNSDIQSIAKTTGLSEEAINELSSIPDYGGVPGSDDYKVAKYIHSKTMRNRLIINLLLTNKRGKKALEALTHYLFATLKNDNFTPFTLELKLPDCDDIWTDKPELSNEVLRGALLEIAVHELKLIQTDNVIKKNFNDRVKILEGRKGRSLSQKELLEVWAEEAALTTVLSSTPYERDIIYKEGSDNGKEK
jgi:transcriptional regulator with XRE-family HTH domain